MSRLRQLLFSLWFCCLIGYAWQILEDIITMLFLICLFPFILRYSFPFTFLFILFSYFRLHEAFPILLPYKIPEFLAICSLVGLSWKLWSSPENIRWQRLHTLYLYFTLWVAFCIPFATNYDLAYDRYVDVFIKIFIMTFAISWIPSEIKQIQRIPLYLFFCSGLICSVVIYNRINHIGLIEGTRVTISRHLGSVLGDPNDLALILQVPLCFSLVYLFSRKTKWQRVGMLLITASLITSTLLTQSRGGLLSLGAAIFMVILIRVEHKIRAFTITGIGSIGVVLFSGLGARLFRSEEQGLGESAMGRLYAWEAAWKMAVENPITGVGMNNFYNNYYRFTLHWDGKNHAVHSTWFEILSESGFVGFILFVLLIYGAIVQSRRLVQRLHAQNDTLLLPLAQSIWISYIALAIGGTFLTQGFTWPIYILLGLLLALERLVQQKDIAHASAFEKTSAVQHTPKI